MGLMDTGCWEEAVRGHCSPWAERLPKELMSGWRGAEVSLRRAECWDGSGTWEKDACCRPRAKGGGSSQAQPRGAKGTGARCVLGPHGPSSAQPHPSNSSTSICWAGEGPYGHNQLLTCPAVISVLRNSHTQSSLPTSTPAPSLTQCVLRGLSPMGKDSSWSAQTAGCEIRQGEV